MDEPTATIRILIEVADCVGASFFLRRTSDELQLDSDEGPPKIYELQGSVSPGTHIVFGPLSLPFAYEFQLVFPCNRRLNNSPVRLLRGPDLRRNPSVNSGLSPFEFLKEGILNSSFDGASGGVQFNSIAGRSATGISVGLSRAHRARLLASDHVWSE